MVRAPPASALVISGMSTATRPSPMKAFLTSSISSTTVVASAVPLIATTRNIASSARLTTEAPTFGALSSSWRYFLLTRRPASGGSVSGLWRASGGHGRAATGGRRRSWVSSGSSRIGGSVQVGPGHQPSRAPAFDRAQRRGVRFRGCERVELGRELQHEIREGLAVAAQRGDRDPLLRAVVAGAGGPELDGGHARAQERHRV